MTELSVVLISKNQEWNIAKLIQSVLQEASLVASNEIILVDSASTDRTIEFASSYPVHIIRLQPGQKLSPAIGRFAGSQQAQGEYVLFLDGDTQLVAGWLTNAFGVMRKAPDVGALTGQVINLSTSLAGTTAQPVIHAKLGRPREVLWGSYGGGGAAMYRRSVLNQVGSFNPYLNSDEEPELGLRIRDAGYRILELDFPIVRHFNDAPISFSTVLNRRRKKFLIGIGQGARYHLRSGLFWKWLRERWWGPASVLWLASGIAALLWTLTTGNPVWAGAWILGFCMLLTFLALRKRSLSRALVAVFNWLLLAEGVVKGFLMRPYPPEKFPYSVELSEDSNIPRRVPDGAKNGMLAKNSMRMNQAFNASAPAGPKVSTGDT